MGNKEKTDTVQMGDSIEARFTADQFVKKGDG